MLSLLVSALFGPPQFWYLYLTFGGTYIIQEPGYYYTIEECAEAAKVNQNELNKIGVGNAVVFCQSSNR